MPRKRQPKPVEIDREITTSETRSHHHRYNPARSSFTSVDMGHRHRVGRIYNGSIRIGLMDGHRHDWR